jgi:hypothetical protein
MQIRDVFSHTWVKRFTKPEEPSLNQSFLTEKLYDIVFGRMEKKKKLNTSRIKNQKIVLKIEKEIQPEFRVSSIKEIEDESQSMLKEIQEIGKQLDDYNHRVNKVHKNTKRLKEKMEKSSTMDFTNKVDDQINELFISTDSMHKKKISFDIMIENSSSMKNECSTQTESEKSNSTWNSFLKLFQCSN